MVEERIDRRLAAIFAVDVAGYSRLMGADEEGTLRQLKAHRKELVAPTKLTSNQLKQPRNWVSQYRRRFKSQQMK
jgi:hypothetical protein